MSSGTISQTPIRSIAPRGGSKAREQDPEVMKREQGVIEMIALSLIKLRDNQPTILWSFDPKDFKSKGRRNSTQTLVLRKVKKQLSAMAQTRADKMLRKFSDDGFELSKADFDRLAPRAVDFIFSNRWMEVVGETKLKYDINKSRRVKGGRYERTPRREYRLVGKITEAGGRAIGRARAIEANHPSTGNITTIRKAVVA